MNLRNGIWFLVLAVFASSGSAALGQVPEEPFRLRVALYPWVPDAQSFMAWIESDFEAQHPDIDLVVRPLARANEEEFGDLAYDFEKTQSALTSDGADSQHLVEIDTMILGQLIEANAIRAFEVEPGVSFLPAAIEAVTWEDAVYGVPHWMCGYFVISGLEDVRRSQGLSELLGVLGAAGTSDVDLAGDLDGSWDSIMVYLDAFRDTYPSGNAVEALRQEELDASVREGLERLGTACSAGGRNYCGDDHVGTFARGEADALIGYSERLHPILEANDGARNGLHVASATLGEGDRPMLFTDALVLARTCDTQRCHDAAAAFAAYYVSDEVFEVVLMSEDSGPSAPPRYLLPSTTSALDVGRVGADRLYRQLREEIEGARAYPNHGVPEARDAGVIRAELRRALGLSVD